MQQFFRILMFSPRLTVMVFVMLFGGVGGVLHSNGADERKPSNPWSKNNTGSAYSAQQRADDGWGSGTRSSNPKDNASSGVTFKKVYRDADGVIHEAEDLKAIDPDAFQ